MYFYWSWCYLAGFPYSSLAAEERTKKVLTTLFQINSSYRTRACLCVCVCVLYVRVACVQVNAVAFFWSLGRLARGIVLFLTISFDWETKMKSTYFAMVVVCHCYRYSVQ